MPVGTPPGDYVGGLIIQSPPTKGKTSTRGDTAFRLDVIQRQGVRIYLNVPGTAIQTMEYGELSWQRTGNVVTVTLPIRNTGNTILHPSATLNISRLLRRDANLTFDTPESMLPGASLNLTARQSPAPALQLGNATATITSEAGIGHARASMIYAPRGFVAIVLLVLVATLYGLWRMARSIRRGRHAIAQVIQAELETNISQTAAPPSHRAIGDSDEPTHNVQ